MSDNEDLIWSIKNGDLDAVIRYVESVSCTWLGIYLYNCFIKNLIIKYPNVINQNINGRSVLHYAADYGVTEIIDFLLKKGANINVSIK